MKDRDGNRLEPGDRVIMVDPHFNNSLWEGKLTVTFGGSDSPNSERVDYIYIMNKDGFVGGFLPHNLLLEDPRDDEVRERFGEDYL